MDKDKTEKKELLELITEILTDENTTVSDFIGHLEKTFDKMKNKKSEEKRHITDEEIEKLLRVAKVVAHSKTPAIFIAGCENDNSELEELVIFAQGMKNDIIPLLGSAVYKVLKESDIPVKEFFKAIEMLEE